MALNYTPSSISGLSSDSKPTAVTTGVVFIETDTKKCYQYDGSAWIQLIVSSGAAKITVGTTQPTSPATNDIWCDTT